MLIYCYLGIQDCWSADDLLMNSCHLRIPDWWIIDKWLMNYCYLGCQDWRLIDSWRRIYWWMNAILESKIDEFLLNYWGIMEALLMNYVWMFNEFSIHYSWIIAIVESKTDELVMITDDFWFFKELSIHSSWIIAIVELMQNGWIIDACLRTYCYLGCITEELLMNPYYLGMQDRWNKNVCIHIYLSLYIYIFRIHFGSSIRALPGDDKAKATTKLYILSLP